MVVHLFLEALVTDLSKRKEFEYRTWSMLVSCV